MENWSCQKMYNLVFYILRHHSLKSIEKWQRYGHLITRRSAFKMTPKPTDGILQPLQQPIVYHICMCLYDRQFQIYSLVMWLLLLWTSALISSIWIFLCSWYLSSWFMTWSATLPSCRFEFGDHLNTHFYWLVQLVYIQSISVDTILKSWSTSNKMRLSLAFVNGFQRIRCQNVQKWICSSFDNLYFPKDDKNFEILVVKDTVRKFMLNSIVAKVVVKVVLV